jgi:hypothetical protein
MHIRQGILLLIGFLLVTVSYGADYSIVLHGNSVHSSDLYDNNTFGIGILHEESQVNTIIGVYRNSVKTTSMYAIRDFPIMKVGKFRTGVFIGAVTGYPLFPVLPLAGVSLQFYNINLNHLPITDGTGSATMLSLTFPLK